MSESIVNTLRAAGCVFAEDEARLLTEAAHTPAELTDMVEQRVKGLPLEQIVGWAEFCGLRIVMEPGVFVPRRRTELLVREALAVVPSGGTVLDLGCGSGAIGAAIQAAATVTLFAVDIDPAAVHCAKRNLDPAQVLEGDLYEPLPHGIRMDVVVANAPYVPTDAIALMPAEARLYEHRVALDGGVDGLSIARRVVAGAPTGVRHVLVETSEAQAPVLAEFMREHGFTPRVAHDEELDATVVIGLS